MIVKDLTGQLYLARIYKNYVRNRNNLRKLLIYVLLKELSLLFAPLWSTAKPIYVQNFKVRLLWK